jgi:hypothetical protein
VQASDSTAGTIVTRDLLAGRYPYYQGDHRYRRPLGISVHDHVIVGKNGHASMKGLRLI